MTSLFRSLVFPHYCLYCKVPLLFSAPLCQTCDEKICPVVSMTLPITEKLTMKVFAACSYQDPVKRLILAKRWSDRTSSFALSELMWKRLPLKELPGDFLVPIPLHWTRYAWRGYNQAAVIAESLAFKTERPFVNALKRLRKTKFQSELSGHERVDNVKNAFRMSLSEQEKKILSNKHIVLVDDLMTTGSTLRSAAKALLILKPASMSAWVTCRII